MWVADLMILDPSFPFDDILGVGQDAKTVRSTALLKVEESLWYWAMQHLFSMSQVMRLHLMVVEQVWTWLGRAELDLFVARPQHPLST